MCDSPLLSMPPRLRTFFMRKVRGSTHRGKRPLHVSTFLFLEVVPVSHLTERDWLPSDPVNQVTRFGQTIRCLRLQTAKSLLTDFFTYGSGVLSCCLCLRMFVKTPIAAIASGSDYCLHRESGYLSRDLFNPFLMISHDCSFEYIPMAYHNGVTAPLLLQPL